MKILRLISVADPDLRIKGGPEISGGVGDGTDSKKIFSWPFGPQFGLKIRRRGGPSPGSATEYGSLSSVI